MKEEIVTLNNVEFRIVGENLIPHNGDMSGKINNKKKHKQNLFSWNWFYQNSLNNLFVTRYHKTTNNKGEIIDVFMSNSMNVKDNKAIYYSQRVKQDRIHSSKINKEIEDIQKEQEKYHRFKTNV